MLTNFPGSIQVGGREITQLRPLGGYHRLGVTKAGRLSFAGLCDGRKVKVYSVFSPAQAALRQSIQMLDFQSCMFPELIAIDENLVVEAWVEGASIASLNGTPKREAERAVKTFVQENLLRSELLGLARDHQGSFCYLNDYLIKRLGGWRHWDVVAGFLERWQGSYSTVAEQLPSHVSHPDLSAANLVLERDTKRLIIVDNELLGVGQGWILDGRNSLLKSDISSQVFRRVPIEFVECTWKLRQLGSALDAEDFSKVLKICRS